MAATTYKQLCSAYAVSGLLSNKNKTGDGMLFLSTLAQADGTALNALAIDPNSPTTAETYAGVALQGLRVNTFHDTKSSATIAALASAIGAALNALSPSPDQPEYVSVAIMGVCGNEDYSNNSPATLASIIKTQALAAINANLG